MKWLRIPAAIVLMTAMLTACGQIVAEEVDMGPQVKAALKKLETRFGLKQGASALVVNPDNQCLYLIQGNRIEASYSISTAARGLGNRNGSYRTPTGTHRICSKYGKNAPVGTIFRARKNAGKIAKIFTDKIDTPKDYVTTRILRLEGMEPDMNKGEGIDSYLRLIYIHGTPEEGLIGTPASHGCIRMKNADVIALFDAVPVGTLVEILPAAKND